jgi:hypothetical protein
LLRGHRGGWTVSYSIIHFVRTTDGLCFLKNNCCFLSFSQVNYHSHIYSWAFLFFPWQLLAASANSILLKIISRLSRHLPQLHFLTAQVHISFSSEGIDIIMGDIYCDVRPWPRRDRYEENLDATEIHCINFFFWQLGLFLAKQFYEISFFSVFFLWNMYSLRSE